MPGVRLGLAEREEISRGIARGESFAAIARPLGRVTSTVSREVERNGGRGRYRAVAAQRQTRWRCRRPRGRKLNHNRRLRAFVVSGLAQRWSPQQISVRLRQEFPDDPSMRVSHETIYQALFCQTRGELRNELVAALRSGRTQRRSRTRPVRHEIVSDKVMISDRPAEVADRAVPGHWEGDLIKGAFNRSGLVTLVERSTRYTMIGALPDGVTAAAVRDRLAALLGALPTHLARSLTWDQGSEMAEHSRFSMASGIDVYFCDPHSPWQRPTNENTNGLLRQYFPKGTDLRLVDQSTADQVAIELNGRPRVVLDGATPAEELDTLIAQTT